MNALTLCESSGNTWPIDSARGASRIIDDLSANSGVFWLEIVMFLPFLIQKALGNRNMIGAHAFTF
jgi:hypothetical protein